MGSRSGLQANCKGVLETGRFLSANEVMALLKIDGMDYTPRQIANGLYQLAKFGKIRSDKVDNKPVYALFVTPDTMENEPGQKRILEYAKQNPGAIIHSELFDELGGSKFRTHAHNIIKRGYLKKIGKKPNDVYEVLPTIAKYNARGSYKPTAPNKQMVTTAPPAQEHSTEVTRGNIMDIDVPFGKVQEAFTIMEQQNTALKNGFDNILRLHLQLDEELVRLGVLKERS